jgi:transcriptional regulator with XRE-family HTH domain
MSESRNLMGARIRALRELRNWSQLELAETLRQAGAMTRRETIIDWESGKAEPRAATIRLLAEVLGTSMDYLNGSGEDTPTGNAKWDGTLQSLKDDEKILLKLYGELGEDEKRFLRRQIEALQRERDRGDA